MYFKILLISSLAFSFSSLSNESYDWEHKKTKSDISIYTKAVKGSRIRALRGVGVLNAPISNISAILRDVKSATQWVPDLVARTVMEELSDTEAILNDVTNMPWPVTDRDFIAHYKLVLNHDKKSMSLNFESVEHKNDPKNNSHIRAIIQTGEIKFTPVDQSRTKVELNVLVDPKGGIPIWIVNMVQVSVPFNFLDALGKFAQKTNLKPLPGVQKILDQIIWP